MNWRVLVHYYRLRVWLLSGVLKPSFLPNILQYHAPFLICSHFLPLCVIIIKSFPPAMNGVIRVDTNRGKKSSLLKTNSLPYRTENHKFYEHFNNNSVNCSQVEFFLPLSKWTQNVELLSTYQSYNLLIRL